MTKTTTIKPDGTTVIVEDGPDIDVTGLKKTLVSVVHILRDSRTHWKYHGEYKYCDWITQVQHEVEDYIFKL
jgi:hypothetical protein